MTGFSPVARRRTGQARDPIQVRYLHRTASATITATSLRRLILPARKNDYEVAQYIAEEWKKQGLEDVVIRQYDVLGTRPVSTMLEMVAPKKYQAVLREQPYDVDPDTKNPEIASAWIGFSTSGEVTAPVVYAHSGNPEDYELLRKNGIDVKGKIVLVRYSNPYSYRGFKALTAQRMGAAALLIYSDPAEDGYKKGKVFPDGPWGPESHIQRGAITYDFMVPGDPLTPGWASLPGAKRIPESEAVSLPHIIALPLSWHDAQAPARKHGRSRRSQRLAGRPADHLSPRRLGDRAPQSRDGQLHPALLRRRSPHQRQRVSRRMGAARQSSRRVGVRRRRSQQRHRLDDGDDPRLRSHAEAGHPSAPHPGLRQLGRRRSRPHRLHRMGRAVRRRASHQAGRLPQRRFLRRRPNFHGGASGSLAPMLVETSYSIAEPRRRHSPRRLAEIDRDGAQARTRQPARAATTTSSTPASAADPTTPSSSTS